MTPNFSFQESCCRRTGVFNIPPPRKKKKKTTPVAPCLVWKSSFSGFQLLIHPLFSVSTRGFLWRQPAPKVWQVEGWTRVVFSPPWKEAPRRESSELMHMKLSSHWFCAQIPDHLVVPIYDKPFLPARRCKCKLSTSGVPRNRPSIEIAKSLPY